MRLARKLRAALAALLIAGTALPGAGCATITGTVTGAFTGAVDLPAEVYRGERLWLFGEAPKPRRHWNMDEDPMLWTPTVVIFVPLGIALGPVAGMAKGIALDAQWLVGKVRYSKVFGSYDEESIWRPHTGDW